MRRALPIALLMFVFGLASGLAGDFAITREMQDRQAHGTYRSQSRFSPTAITQARSDYWVLIPVAGSAAGAFGTFFKSDVMISNHRAQPQLIDVSFFQQGQNGAGGFALKRLTIPANGMVFYPDMVANTLGKSGLGTLDVRARDATGSLDTDAKIDVFSRIWTPQANTAGTQFAGGTTSQAFPSVIVDSLTGRSSAYILGLQQDDRFRTNIGIHNDDLSNAHTFTARVVGTNGQTTFTVTVPAWSMVQTSLPAGNFGSLYVILTPDSSFSSFEWWAAYGSSVDGITGDGWASLASQND